MDKAMVEALKPGRELNTLIAERVMGLTLVKGTGLFCGQTLVKTWDGPDDPYKLGDDAAFEEALDSSYALPHFSAEIAAAWTVAEKLASGNGVEFNVERTQYVGGYKMAWGAFFSSRKKGELARAFAATAPEAICKAALLAILKEPV